MQLGIEAEDLSVRLGGRAVLTGISLHLEPGQWIGIVGPNGSGKTTLLRSLAGLVPYEGSVRVDGTTLADWSKPLLARRLSFVRQFSDLAFDFRVLDLVMMGRTPYKKWLQSFDQEDKDAALRALSVLDLEQFGDRSALELSGGELRRVLLAQGLTQEADYLLLDEPTAHLDVHHRFGFLEHVRSRVDEGGSALAAFHDLDLAARFVDSVIVLRDGEMVESGTPRDVLRPDLIQSVFEMAATISPIDDEAISIRYLRRIPPEKQESVG